MTNVQEQVSAIRDHIDSPRLKYILSKDGGNWAQLCSSLDVIDDLELAIEAYIGSEFPADDRSNVGALYLAVYGLLQALVVQQDAARHVCESLAVPYDPVDHPRFNEIRRLRHATVGHPTRKDKPKPTSHHFISRMSLKKSGYTLLSITGDEPGQFERVELGPLIAHQREGVSLILASVVTELERRAAAHRARFMNDRRLADAFPDVLGYAVEKMLGAVRGSDIPELGLWGVETVEEALAEFRDRLVRQEMDIDTFGDIAPIYEGIGYAAPQLKAYLRGESSDIANVQLAGIVADYVHRKIDELKMRAQEIDGDAYSV